MQRHLPAAAPPPNDATDPSRAPLVGRERVRIPTFGLYGTEAEPGLAAYAHIERIASRRPSTAGKSRHTGTRTCPQLLMVTDGGGIVTVDGAAHPIQPPWFVWLPAGVVHGFAFEAGTSGHVLTLSADTVGAAVSASPDQAAVSGLVESRCWVPFPRPKRSASTWQRSCRRIEREQAMPATRRTHGANGKPDASVDRAVAHALAAQPRSPAGRGAGFGVSPLPRLRGAQLSPGGRVSQTLRGRWGFRPTGSTPYHDARGGAWSARGPSRPHHAGGKARSHVHHQACCRDRVRLRIRGPRPLQPVLFAAGGHVPTGLSQGGPGVRGGNQCIGPVFAPD